MILVVVASLTGNTASFVDFLLERYPSIELEVLTLREARKREINFSLYSHVFLGSYTWDNGKIPVQMKRWVIDNREELLKKSGLVFGSGWTIYKTFCKAVYSINFILDDKYYTFPFELGFSEKLELEKIRNFELWLKDQKII